MNMQIVFMNRLSRISGVDQEMYAQLWIGEEEGIWSLGWRDFSGGRITSRIYGMKVVLGMKCSVYTGMS
ncbi:hypothetical protein [Paenibacillus sp. RS8]|uniref:hypothetical protein n=1 Tax=Paenibacillus sp. RS8 TaxID=3242681 RepID=UPI0035C0F766